jgi:hypothetical protein
MKSTHGAPCRNECFVASPHGWDEFVDDVVIPSLMLFYSPPGISTAVTPRLRIDAVTAYNSDASVFDPRREHIYHVEVFVIIEPSIL